MRSPGCAAHSREAGETTFGTAPERAAGWLLIEHPGPWPAQGPPTSAPAVLNSLLDQAELAGVRTQFIRRTAARRAVPPHTVYLAHTTGPQPWLLTATVEDLEELRGLDLAAVAAGRRPDFGAPSDPVLLVCTHGQREICCARYGRPTATTLADRFGDAVWETSHVGGDRFAGNIVCLPYGTYHGRASAANAASIGAAALRGDVVVRHFRGRSGWPAAVQAADCYARRLTGVTEVHAVRRRGYQAHPDGRTQVDLSVRGRELRVVVRPAPLGRPFLTSCAVGAITDPEVHLLDHITELSNQQIIW